MERIVDVHFPGIKKQLLSEALEAFFEIREVPGLKKKPSTSELLDWLKLLMAEDIPPEALHSQDTHKIVPPLHGALIKNEQDVHLFERLVFMSAVCVRASARTEPRSYARYRSAHAPATLTAMLIEFFSAKAAQAGRRARHRSRSS